MNYRFATLFFALFICACSKDKQGDDNTPGNVEVKVDYIQLSTYKFARGYDTTSNYIANYLFRLVYDYKGSFIATTNPADQKYYIKYVGTEPLIEGDSVIYNNGELMMLPINNALKGKAIFEMYQVSDNKLFKRITASADSCRISASFSVWANNSITVPQIRSAFNYYLSTKQTPDIKYYFIN